MKATFFPTPAKWRAWLARHHASRDELWVGFHKRATGKPSITWPESVDEALCFGWIDGIRKSLGAKSYMIRFTPRRTGSIWSTVNIRRVRELVKLGRMRPAGSLAFEGRIGKHSERYSYEWRKRGVKLPGPLARLLKADAKAWRFLEQQPEWYRRTTVWFVLSAKQDQTRQRRLETLRAACAKGRWIGILAAKQPRAGRVT